MMKVLGIRGFPEIEDVCIVDADHRLDHRDSGFTELLVVLVPCLAPSPPSSADLRIVEAVDEEVGALAQPVIGVATGLDSGRSDGCNP